MTRLDPRNDESAPEQASGETVRSTSAGGSTRRALAVSLTVTSALLLATLVVGGPVGSLVFTVIAGVFPVLLMGLGALRGNRLGRLRWALLALAMLIVGSLLTMIGLRGQVADGPWILGLPLAAAIQLLGLFGLPIVLVSLTYGLGFEHHGVTDRDLEALRALDERPTETRG